MNLLLLSFLLSTNAMADINAAKQETALLEQKAMYLSNDLNRLTQENSRLKSRLHLINSEVNTLTQELRDLNFQLDSKRRKRK